jgi:hypothetical protein
MASYILYSKLVLDTYFVLDDQGEIILYNLTIIAKTNMPNFWMVHVFMLLGKKKGEA